MPQPSSGDCGTVKVCRRCGFSSRSSLLFMRHEQHCSAPQGSGGKPQREEIARSREYRCDRCELTTTESREYLRHRVDVHGDSLVVHECNRCAYASVSKYHLREHKQRWHPLLTESPIAAATEVISITDDGSSVSSASSGVPTCDAEEKRVTMRLATPGARARKSVAKAKPRHVAAVTVAAGCGEGRDGINPAAKGPAGEPALSPSRDNVHRCADCAYSTTCEPNMRRHRAHHLLNGPVRCPHCSFSASNSVRIAIHISSYHPGGDRPQGGKQCGRNKASRGRGASRAWRGGKAVEQQGDGKQWRGKNEVGDQECDKAWGSRDSADKDEVLLDDLPRCCICLKGFSTHTEVRMHCAAAHPSAMVLECTLCAVVCLSHAGLNRHYARAHGSEQGGSDGRGVGGEAMPIKAEIVDEVFDSAAGFFQVSLAERSDDEAGRQTTAPTSSDEAELCTIVNVEEGTVTKIRGSASAPALSDALAAADVPARDYAASYRCPCCTFVCRTRVGLERHAMCHADAKLYACLYCPFCSVWKYCMEAHIERRHSVEIARGDGTLRKLVNMCFQPGVKSLAEAQSVVEEAAAVAMQTDARRRCAIMAEVDMKPSVGVAGKKHAAEEPPAEEVREGKQRKRMASKAVEADELAAASANVGGGAITTGDKYRTTFINGKTMYGCRRCAYQCESARKVLMHDEIHDDLRRFVCSACGLRANFHSNIQQHVKTRHADPSARVRVFSHAKARRTLIAYKAKFTSGLPLMVVSTGDVNKGEERTGDSVEIDEKASKGSPTASTTSNKRKSPRAFRTVVSGTGKKLWACCKCHYRVGSSDKMANHVRAHAKAAGPQYGCRMCGHRSTSTHNARKHELDAHGLTPDAIAPGPQRTEIGGNMAYKPPVAVSASQRVGEDAPMTVTSPMKALGDGDDVKYKVYRCSKCGLRSGWRSNIRKHVQSRHTGGRVERMGMDEARRTLADYLALSHPALCVRTRSPGGAKKAGSSGTKVVGSGSMKVMGSGIANVAGPDGSNVVEPGSAYVARPSGSNVMGLKPSNFEGGIRRYKCSYCGLRYHRRHAALRHIATRHMQAEVVILSEADAQATLAQYHALKVAKRKVVGIKNARVKSARTKVNFKDRYLKRPYGCTQCKFRSNYRACVKRHADNVHGGGLKATGQLMILETGRSHRHDSNGSASDENETMGEEVETIPADADDASGRRYGGSRGLKSASYLRECHVSGLLKKSNVVGSSLRLLRCGVCPFTSVRPGSLRQHLLSHTERPGCAIRCPVCPFYVHAPGHLIKHVLLHKRAAAAAGKGGAGAIAREPAPVKREAAALVQPMGCTVDPTDGLNTDQDVVSYVADMSKLKQRLIAQKSCAVAAPRPSLSAPRLALSAPWPARGDDAPLPIKARTGPIAEDSRMKPECNDEEALTIDDTDCVDVAPASSRATVTEVRARKTGPGNRKRSSQARRSFFGTHRARSTAGTRAEDSAEQQQQRCGCEKCPFTTRRLALLKRHIALHGAKQRYECEYCDYSVARFQALVWHRTAHLAPNPNLLSLQSVGNLRHLPPADEPSSESEAEPGEEPEEEPGDEPTDSARTFRCERCPYSCFTRETFVTHLRHHVVRGAFVCPFCDYSDAERDDIKAHALVHFNVPGAEMNAYPASYQSDFADDVAREICRLCESDCILQREAEGCAGVGAHLDLKPKVSRTSHDRLRAPGSDSPKVAVNNKTGASAPEQTADEIAGPCDYVSRVRATRHAIQSSDGSQDSQLNGDGDVKRSNATSVNGDMANAELCCESIERIDVTGFSKEDANQQVLDSLSEEAGLWICQYCDLDCDSNADLRQHEVHHLFGNQFALWCRC